MAECKTKTILILNDEERKALVKLLNEMSTSDVARLIGSESEQYIQSIFVALDPS